MSIPNTYTVNNIYNENCFDRFESMSKDSVDCVFTSPPYNRKRNDKYTHYDDDIDNYRKFLVDVITSSTRVSRGNVFINLMPNYYNRSDVYHIIGVFSNSLSNIFIWEKSNPLPASGNAITNAYEMILCFGKIKSNTTYTKNHLTTPVAIMDKEHKASMNRDVSDFFISKFTKENDLVYDPFMGTGTTAISCHLLKRNWIGSEISKEYVELAYKRLEPYLTQTTLF